MGSGRTPQGLSPSGGWRVIEVGEAQEDGDSWFDETVKPNLPPGAKVDRQYYPVHTALTR